MKRDMELLRQILLFVEAQDMKRIADVELEGWTSDEVFYHMQLADDAGWLRDVSFTHDGGATASALTMAGHDFLEATRNETVWQRVKAMIAEKGPGVPLEVIKALAVAAVKERFGVL